MQARKQGWSRSIRPGMIALLLLIAVAGAVRTVRAAEIIPSYGLTQSTDSNADTKSMVGLALRGNLFPMLQTEIGVGYRSESRYDGNLHVRMWPVTASLYANPFQTIYAGAGVGWYQTTFDYSNNLLIPDETKQNFGVHVGGGFQIPLAPSAAVDLGGRYVMLRDQESHLIPEKFNPDFWVTQLGLAIKF
ncbi:MAG TPA: outer membrane beta-barrel protein [Gemmatimonadaceae bacterium]|nr:outer membrane beta-barrel protein [Gemmatimonadaceae bacterium]